MAIMQKGCPKMLGGKGQSVNESRVDSESINGENVFPGTS
jgi:hypothetical protein